MDNFSLILIITGILAALAIIAYFVFYFKKGKNEVKEETQDALFDYLVKEIEQNLRAGKVKEASSIFNRLNHVYEYVEKSKKPGAKKKLDELYNDIQADKGEFK